VESLERRTCGKLRPGEAHPGEAFNIGRVKVLDGPLAGRDGVITTFDVPGAGTGVNHGTYAGGMNGYAGVTGWYIDGNNAYHGFVRTP
jgi:hypothetical protein